MGKPCPDFCVLPFSAVLFKTVAASHTCYIYLFFLVSTSCSFKTLFWLCQVFIAASGLFVVAVEREFLSSACAPASDCGSFSSCRAWGPQLWRLGLVVVRHVGSSWTRDRTRDPQIGRQIQGSPVPTFNFKSLQLNKKCKFNFSVLFECCGHCMNSFRQKTSHYYSCQWT